MTNSTKFNAVDLYATPKDRFCRTSQAMYLAKDSASGSYCIGVINVAIEESPRDGYAVLTREDMIELRDALNREFAN